MDSERDRKRRKEERRGDDNDREKREYKRHRRPRSRSRSPESRRDKESHRKRKYSRSPSIEAAKGTSQRQQSPDVKKEAPERKNKDTDMLNTRTGGAYIPPARLRMMQAQITDKSSVAYQRLAWEALKKSIHGHINKINVGNIGIIIKELLRENIVRGRGLLSRSVIQAQAASPTFTNVYAALVAAINSRFPNIGELLLKRLVIQFKRGFKRNDKPICISSASFIAHLVNQRVAHEILALELLTLLVETPTNDSVEVAIAFLKECGQKLTEVSSKGVNAIFEMLRNILHEGQLDKRVQYMIEVMFQVWKDGFKDHPALIEELELVPEEEQFTHLLMLDDATDAQDILNVFKHDEKFEENEDKYKNLCKEILGSDVESGDEEGSGSESGSEESGDEEENDEKKEGVTIIDNTETNLVALRRTIYLTINSSLDFEECAHKLMKMQLKPGQELELCHMFLDCCAEQRTYEKFYGLLAQRFCNINRIYIEPFENIFKDSYATAHRLDTNRLRNVSKFFAHLLFTDSISWEVLECVKLNEEDTTSSSRIYIKILFQELAEYMGLKKLNDRLKDPTLQGAFSGVFPRDNPKNTRFSINFFTSIGLGGLTDELREHLKQMPKNVPNPLMEIKVGSSSESSSDSSSSDSSDDSSSSSSSDSDDEADKNKKKKKKKDKTPKTPEETPNKDSEKPKERWGHDGFYETYGKDARRHDRQPAQEGDTFRRPKGREDYNDRTSRNDARHRDNRNQRDDDGDRNKIHRNGDRNRGNDEDRNRGRGRNDDDNRINERDNESRRGRRNSDDDSQSRVQDNRRIRRDDDSSQSRKKYDESTSHEDERSSGRKHKDDDYGRRRRETDDNYSRTRDEDDRRKRRDNEGRRGRNDNEHDQETRGQRTDRREEEDRQPGRRDERDKDRNRDKSDQRKQDKRNQEDDAERKNRNSDDSKRKEKNISNTKEKDTKSKEDNSGTPEQVQIKRYYEQFDYPKDSSDDDRSPTNDDDKTKSKKKKSHKSDSESESRRHKKNKKKKSRSEKENNDWDIKNKDQIEKDAVKINNYDTKSREKKDWDIERRERSESKDAPERYWGGERSRARSPQRVPSSNSRRER